jgi:hypothetical protein
MDPREFEVLITLTRAQKSGRDESPQKAVVCNAARRVLIDGVKPTDAAKEFGLRPQSVSNAVTRLRKAEAIVLSGYAHKSDRASERWKYTKIQLSDAEFKKMLRVFGNVYMDAQVDPDDPRAAPIAEEVYVVGTQKSNVEAAKYVCQFWHESAEAAPQVAKKVRAAVSRMKFTYMKG